jgi:hypothetical protein
VKEAEDLHLTVFTPNIDVNLPATRGEVIQTILEVTGFPILPKGATDFTDVPVNHPFAAAIATAEAYEIVSGDTGLDGQPLHRFRPDDNIVRAEVAKIITLVREALR